jgi:hypothetical protein
MGEIISQDVSGRLKRSLGHYTDLTSLTSQLADITTLKIYAGMPPYNVTANGQDQTVNIQKALDDANTKGINEVILPTGTLITSATLNLYTHVRLVGSGTTSTVISTNANTFDAITLPSNGRKMQIRDLTITSSAGVGTSNAAIKADDTMGGAEQLFYNVEINSFYYGFKMKNDWWNNTLENVRFNSCAYSFMGDGSDGQSINNVFIRVYSNQPTIMGYKLSAIKAWTFIDCNFGGHPTLTTQYMQFPSTCYNVKLIGCNFEQIIIPANAGGIEVWSGSMISISNCTFINNNGTAAYAYEIAVKESAKVIIDSFYQYQNGSNIKQLGMFNSGQVTLVDDSLTDVTHATGSTATTKVNALGKPRKVRSMEALQLNGGVQNSLVLVPSSNGRITGLKLVYTEASSVDAGVTITLKNSFDTIYTGTSEVSKAQFYVLNATLAKTSLYANDPLIFTTNGGKTGTGKIVAEVEYMLD